MQVRVKDAGPFRLLYNLPKGTNTIICIGGRGGRKTYEVSKYALKSACIDKKRIAVLRDEKETIRESILNEIFLRYDTANQYGHFDGIFEKNERGIRYLENGEMMVFTKGFRASSTQKTASLKSISDVDIAIIEEAEDIRDPVKFNTFADSIRKQNSIIIIVLNTPDINHWIVKRYFDLENIIDEHGRGTGYFQLKPKSIKGFVCIQTNFKDNPFLPEHTIEKYESYGKSESSFYDPHYYYTAILGYASSGRRGQIFTKVNRLKLKDYIELPYKEYYGQDFGTNSPAGMVGVKFHKDNVYMRELNYKPMDLVGIGKMYCSLKLTNNDVIIADSAEPHSINKLRNGWKKEELKIEDTEVYPGLTKGFYVLGCVKGPGSVEAGIGLMKSLNLHVVEESVNFWNEIQNYIYAVDRNNNPLDEPIDEYNHLIDPSRYVIMARGRFF